ncbi:aldo/keto reductase [Rhodospirillaceae bacterium KN72]|uniref:Aldo/keto reductase n=1 Tax=Pacificispira spongiicola TaxID=2729598 RepID=A0A7Y0E3H0_9PROT|nr:aldo/keto reductase [Pacificispira spongiicola]NMM46458.1 aldo/keto reductase [Pacificispira spongiicola]
MEYVKFGRTGMDVSKLVLGCMSFGTADRGAHAWTLSEEESRPLIRHALEAGINFLDTANIYSDGTSEEIIGRAIRDYARRDEIVLATKVFYRMRPGPNGAGLSRKAIFAEIDASLTRLGTDYVDLYQIHRWDYLTPIEETMEALHDVVKAGKALHIGASSMWTWQFAKANHIAVQNGWTPFISMQNHVNLLHREEEREMLPYCRDQNIAVIPWSPLARGRLTRPWDQSTKRLETDQVSPTLYMDSDAGIVARVAEIAERRDIPMAQVALAWVLQKDGITGPIIGATKMKHLDDAIAALSVSLDAEEIAALEELYAPRPVVGLAPPPK